MAFRSRTPSVEAIPTEDGSLTLRQCDTGWTYRSTHGAWQESKTVFVDGSRVAQCSSPVRIVEFGFGAGINFATTLQAIDGPIDYWAIERAWVDPSQLPIDPSIRSFVREAMAHGQARRELVTLTLASTTFEDFASERRFDAIYFDPFGPTDEPQSWSQAVFDVARVHAESHARLVTYSAAGWIRRNLAAAGFYVATMPGPPGKREFTVASLDPDQLSPLRVRNAPG